MPTDAPLLPVFVVLGTVLLGRRVTPRSKVRREDPGDPDIAAAGELQPGTARRPDIILPPAVADASTATVSASVGHAGPDVQQQLYAEGSDERAGEHGDGAGAAAAADHWRNAGRVPPGRQPAEVGICASGGGIRRPPRATCSPPGRPRRTTCNGTASTWPTAAASGWPPSGWCCAASPPPSPCSPWAWS